MGIFSPPASRDAWCPKCSAALSGETPRCNACGYSLEGVSLYDPKHFVWLAFLFSAMVPIYLAASNWGKIGESRKRWRWLALGFSGLTLLFTLLMILRAGTGASGSHVGRSLGMLIGYVINLPIGYALRGAQRPAYEAALLLGARRGSLFKGTVFGMGFVLCAMAPPLAFYVARYQADFRRGSSLIEQHRYDEAAAVFEGLLREDPGDEGAALSLALCHVQRNRLPEAAEGLERYLRINERSSTAYAFLAAIRADQGSLKEAEALAAKARALDPRVFEDLFGSDVRFLDAPAGAPLESP